MTADVETTRQAFEDRAFSEFFKRSVKRNPSPPSGTGALNFVYMGEKTQAELCARAADGQYLDDGVAAMWLGWQWALAYANASLLAIAQAQFEAACSRHEQLGLPPPPTPFYGVPGTEGFNQ